MASALIEERNYKHIAEKYSNANELQIKYGKKLVKLLDMKRGDKVVDMGCGTGEITSFTASQVGEEGEVLGIDPDQERIKVAVHQNGLGAKKNIKFMVGDSSSHFPHCNEEYYDVHYSNFVFHWLTTQEKDVYLKTAFNCLKPGGRIVILNADRDPEAMEKIPELLPDDEIEKNRPPSHFVEKSVAQYMVEKSGFVIHFSDYIKGEDTFPNLDSFLTWFCASDYMDESKIVPHKKEAFAKKFVNEDGAVCIKSKIFIIIAKKEYEHTECL